MLKNFLSKMTGGWSIFSEKQQEPPISIEPGVNVTAYRDPSRRTLSRVIARSIITGPQTKIINDLLRIRFRHIMVNDDEQFLSIYRSNMDRCLNVTANGDQTGLELLSELVKTMFEVGYAALVPVSGTVNPENGRLTDIYNIRVSQVKEWRPRHIKVELFDERQNRFRETWISKTVCAIFRNPFYDVMNQPNSTFSRLQKKLDQLDITDDDIASGKLDILMQFPFSVNTEKKMKQAEERRSALEAQMTGSKYGIGWIDSTEKVIQLNRPVENSLLKSVEYMTKQFYAQLGMSDEVMLGTATELQMANYFNSAVAPIAITIVAGLNKSFLTPTAYTQGQRFAYFRNPFEFLTAANVGDVADKLTTAEIVSGNEFRGYLGLRPSDSSSANELRNPHLNKPKDQVDAPSIQPPDIGE